MSTPRRIPSMLIAFLVFAGAVRVGAADPPRSPPYSVAAYRAGRADATRDIKRGILAVEEWGLPADFAASDAYRRILKEKYGITVRRVAGCEVDDTILGHGNGYNDVSYAEIRRRFGPDLLGRVYARAEKQHARSRR